MSTADIRVASHRYLDELDEETLVAVHAMLATYAQNKDELKNTIIGYTPAGEAVNAAQFHEQSRRSIELAKQGRRISVDELEKRAKEWLSNT